MNKKSYRYTRLYIVIAVCLLLNHRSVWLVFPAYIIIAVVIRVGNFTFFFVSVSVSELISHALRFSRHISLAVCLLPSVAEERGNLKFVGNILLLVNFRSH